MLNQYCSSMALLLLVGICIILMLTQQFQLAQYFNNHHQLRYISSMNGNVVSLTDQHFYSDDTKSLPGTYNLLEDSLRHSNAMDRPTKECTLEFMNYNRLQQDHPCVINYIRRHYLKVPPPTSVSLNLDYPEVIDPSDGQPETVLKQFKNKTNGFFVECGALDGENLSNTLYLERFFNWTGILIEADQDSFENLLSRKRSTWSLPVCLSIQPYPTKVTFRINYALGQIIGIGLPEKNLTAKTSSKGRDVELQCFPFYSILLAVGRTQIDFFSLDVEGHELLILKTIPFEKVNIKMLTVEWTGGEVANIGMGKEQIITFMETKGYETIIPVVDVQHDMFFMKRENE